MQKYWLKFYHSLLRKEEGFSQKVAALTGFQPRKIELYNLAFTHSSASFEYKGKRLNNERLEFLGDAILGAVVSDYLYENYPKKDEGFLTTMRSKIVCRQHLNLIAEKIHLPHLLNFNTTGDSKPKSINGDAFEALIGALFLDRGYRKCERFIIYSILKKHVNLQALSTKIYSHKRLIMEWAAKNKKELCFKLESQKGQSHNRSFEISLWCNQERVARGEGSSKKKAEEDAAKNAYHELALSYDAV
jgi:ribonuclease-3